MAPRPYVLTSDAYMTDGLEPRSQAMPPKDFQPKNDETGAEDCRPEHCAQGHKRLIPPRREPGDQLLDEVQLVHDLGEVVAGLGGLAEGEALGVEIGHVACFALGTGRYVAHSCLMFGYRVSRRDLALRGKSSAAHSARPPAPCRAWR